MKRILFAVLTGLLLSISFPPFPLFFTSFFAFIPILWVINAINIEQAGANKINFKTLFNKFKYIYISFFIYHLITNWWISTLQDNSDIYLFFAGIALDFAHPLFFFIPFLILFIAIRLIGWNKSVWLFPLFWTFFEYIHSIGDLGYSWLSIAHSQYNNLLFFQILDIQGIYLATLIILYVNIFLYKILENYIECKKESTKFKLNRAYVLCIWALIVLPLMYGWAKINQYEFDKDYVKNEKNDFINVALIQPNENPWNKWDKNKEQQINILSSLSDSLLAIDKPIHLIVWPETAIPFLNGRINADLKLDFMDGSLIKNNTALLTGISRLYFYKEGDDTAVTATYLGNSLISYYNSALLYQPNFIDKAQLDNASYSVNGNSSSQTYDKIRLTPFAERVPFVDYFPFIRDFFQWSVGISGWTQGNKVHPLVLHNDSLKNGSTTKMINYDSLKIGVVICIESIHPHHVRDLVRQGANLLVVITNDSWYDGSYGPRQHYIISCARAVEQRRYVARCANSGVSGIISPTGRSIAEAPQYRRTGISHSVPLMELNDQTIYAYCGDILPLVCIIVAAFIVLYVRLRKG